MSVEGGNPVDVSVRQTEPKREIPLLIADRVAQLRRVRVAGTKGATTFHRTKLWTHSRSGITLLTEFRLYHAIYIAILVKQAVIGI